jgi:hypothetical protein
VLSQADNSIKKQLSIAQSAQAGVSEKLAVNCSGMRANALIWVLFNNWCPISLLLELIVFHMDGRFTFNHLT